MSKISVACQVFKPGFGAGFWKTLRFTKIPQLGADAAFYK